MVDNIKDREKAFENKFVHEGEIKFKVDARRRKLLGLWAAESMGYGEVDSLKYAMEIVNYGLDNTADGAVISKIATDFESKAFSISEETIREKNQELEIVASRQISSGTQS